MRMDYIDGVEPPPMRLKVERNKIERENNRRAKGDYNLRPVSLQSHRNPDSVVEETEAWATYQAQIAAGKADEPPKRHRKLGRRSELRALRHELCWSQTRVAEKAGLSLKTIRAAEEGSPVRERSQRRILKALSVPWSRRWEFF